MTQGPRSARRWPGAAVGLTTAALALAIALPAVGAEPTPEPDGQQNNDQVKKDPAKKDPAKGDQNKKDPSNAGSTKGGTNSGQSNTDKSDPTEQSNVATKADVAAYEAAKKALLKARVRYAKAVVAHKESMAQVKKLEKKAKRAERVADKSRRDLGNMARLAYTSGDQALSLLAGLIDAQTPEDLVDRAATAERVTDHQSVEVDTADEDAATAIRLRKKARDFLDATVDELAESRSDLRQTKELAKGLDLETRFNISGKPVDLGTDSDWVFPVPGAAIGSEAGMRLHPILGYVRCHAGADISAGSGSAIHAVDDGIVVSATGGGGYGNYTVISHGRGLTSAYAHQSAMLVEAGDTVERGQVIGAVGSTGLSSGPHLHFEARYFGDPYNPRGWLDNKPRKRVPVC